MLSQLNAKGKIFLAAAVVVVILAVIVIVASVRSNAAETQAVQLEAQAQAEASASAEAQAEEDYLNDLDAGAQQDDGSVSKYNTAEVQAFQDHATIAVFEYVEYSSYETDEERMARIEKGFGPDRTDLLEPLLGRTELLTQINGFTSDVYVDRINWASQVAQDQDTGIEVFAMEVSWTAVWDSAGLDAVSQTGTNVWLVTVPVEQSGDGWVVGDVSGTQITEPNIDVGSN